MTLTILETEREAFIKGFLFKKQEVLSGFSLGPSSLLMKKLLISVVGEEASVLKKKLLVSGPFIIKDI